MPRNTVAGAGSAAGGEGGAPEPSSPVQKVWKPELYKLQLEAPAPCPLRCQRTLPLPPAKSTAAAVEANNAAGRLYGSEYHGLMGHLEAEQLLANARDGSYLVRLSPQSDGYYTLSLRYNKTPKNYKILHKPGVGHYLLGQDKRFDTVHDMVADGLINFHMQLHASPIIQQINQQTRNCYQQSPYMTLNGRKLRALSNEMGGKGAAAANPGSLEAATKSKGVEAEAKPKLEEETPLPALDPMPLVYEKLHHFKVHTFKGLNWCEFCANFLWGFTAQGVKCEACGFVAHTKCSELVPPKCVPDLKRIRGVFGTDLTTMVQLEPHHLIPFVVRRCVEEVEARGMLQEGIYRVSGFADEIEALKLALDRDGEKTDMSETTYGNVNVIAGTLKLYLRLLPVPLITFQAYPSFMAAGRNGKQAEQLQLMTEAVRHLPPAHYTCLQYMLEHLKRVASHYAVNKMNEHNLATVFAPTLIATPQHMTNLTEEIFMLSSLIAHCKTIFARN
ncbi:N-chimaerin [Drosophila kikkawai]|uniref:N-chimaerin n=1 Tax=Drosophila kikkawai TaxID=30033 RepID=A0A6P4ILC9_DROKI|nr:N-chimaerin [Drosophila kikkawai]